MSANINNEIFKFKITQDYINTLNKDLMTRMADEYAEKLKSEEYNNMLTKARLELKIFEESYEDIKNQINKCLEQN